MHLRRALALCAALVVMAQAASAQNKQLTIDDIFDPVKRVDFNGYIPRISWMPDGKSYVLANTDRDHGPIGLTKVDAVSGKSEPLLDTTRLAKALEGSGIPAPDAQDLASGMDFTFNDTMTALVVDFGDDLYWYDVASGRSARLTSTPGAETNVSFSPDGRRVGFVRDGNLYVVDVATQAERALTTDGGGDRLNGRLDWVYEEELYGRGQTTAYWWSPDSSMLAYLSLDDAKVPTWVLTDDVPMDQTVELTKYPQVGDPNPTVRVGAVAAAGGATHWMDLSAYEPANTLVVRVGWTPDSKRVVYEVQNRTQSWLELMAAGATGGKPSMLLRESSNSWIDAIDVPAWLPDGSFLWQSERTGYRHVYHYAADGTLLGAVTAGDWDVRDLYGAAPDGWVYFAAAERSPIANHVYRVRLDGSSMARLSATEGGHFASFNPQRSMYVDIFSTATMPPQTRLFDSSGKLVRTIEENHVAALDQYNLGRVEFMQVKTRDGFPMEAMMIKPPNFDPSKKYPVMSYTYSGPGAQSVRDSWGRQTYLWHQLLARHGYIIWVCDNRSASAKGVKTAHTAFHNFGVQELQDLEDGLAWLKQQPYVDGSRIGLWGWSFGGFMTSYALTHSTSFKIGIAGAPVTDWRLYDSIYTERYMGLPGENPEGYAKTSVIRAAADLSGRLLLIHGAIDNNVHLQNSIQFIDALQKSGKQFQFMIYPQSRHGVTHPLRVKHLRAMMTDFILQNL